MKCQFCGSKNDIEHHLSKRSGEVQVLCERCHRYVHIQEMGGANVGKDVGLHRVRFKLGRKMTVTFPTRIVSAMQIATSVGLEWSLTDFVRNSVAFRLKYEFPQIYEDLRKNQLEENDFSIYNPMRCSCCGAFGHLIEHHVSYDPEIIEILCWGCHTKIHGRIKHKSLPARPVSTFAESIEEAKVSYDIRKIYCSGHRGRSYCASLPPDWWHEWWDEPKIGKSAQVTFLYTKDFGAIISPNVGDEKRLEIENVLKGFESKIKHSSRTLYPSGEEGRTKVISFPLEWIRESEIKSGSELHVLWVKDLVVIMTPNIDAKKRDEVEKEMEKLYERICKNELLEVRPKVR